MIPAVTLSATRGSGGPQVLEAPRVGRDRSGARGCSPRTSNARSRTRRTGLSRRSAAARTGGETLLHVESAQRSRPGRTGCRGGGGEGRPPGRAPLVRLSAHPRPRAAQQHRESSWQPGELDLDAVGTAVLDRPVDDRLEDVDGPRPGTRPFDDQILRRVSEPTEPLIAPACLLRVDGQLARPTDDAGCEAPAYLSGRRLVEAIQNTDWRDSSAAPTAAAPSASTWTRVAAAPWSLRSDRSRDPSRPRRAPSRPSTGARGPTAHTSGRPGQQLARRQPVPTYGETRKLALGALLQARHGTPLGFATRIRRIDRWTEHYAPEGQA